MYRNHRADRLALKTHQNEDRVKLGGSCGKACGKAMRVHYAVAERGRGLRMDWQADGSLTETYRVAAKLCRRRAWEGLAHGLAGRQLTH